MCHLLLALCFGRGGMKMMLTSLAMKWNVGIGSVVQQRSVENHRGRAPSGVPWGTQCSHRSFSQHWKDACVCTCRGSGPSTEHSSLTATHLGLTTRHPSHVFTKATDEDINEDQLSIGATGDLTEAGATALVGSDLLTGDPDAKIQRRH